MTISRRDLIAVLLPLLASQASTSAQTPTATAVKRGPIRQDVYQSSKIAYSGDSRKKGREFFRGTTHTGFELEMHETILGPGVPTHEPHRHVHEEIVIVLEGTVEASIDGKTEVAEAGSVIYFGSNQLHNARNAGTTPSRYYVVELRGTND